MILSDKWKEKKIQGEKQGKQTACFGVYEKIYWYLGGIYKELEPFINSQKTSELFFSLKAFSSEDVFAVSLHQMTGKYGIILCHWKETNGLINRSF